MDRGRDRERDAESAVHGGDRPALAPVNTSACKVSCLREDLVGAEGAPKVLQANMVAVR